MRIIGISLIILTMFSFTAFSDSQKVNVDSVALTYATDTKKLDDTIISLEALTQKEPSNEEAWGCLSRLYFLKALLEENKDLRIKKHQKAMDTADKAIALNPKSLQGNFWRAVAMGKQGLDIGINKSLNNAKPMKTYLENVVEVNEKFIDAGAHRALGRLYFKLPGWPFSFGDNKKSYEHLKKAVELSPNHFGNHAFFAETAYKLDKIDEARASVKFLLDTPVDDNHKREYAEYVEIAKKLQKKLE